LHTSARPVVRRGPLVDLAQQPAHLPMFVRIARAFSSAIEAGRLPSGTRLLGSRALAAELHVHRNTALAAFAELICEGYVTTEQGRGTFVARDLPRPRVEGAFAPARMPEQPAFPFTPRHGPRFEPPPRGAIVLYGGLPDVSLLPRAAFARAYRRALSSTRDDPWLYGSPYGEPVLRRALAQYLRIERGLAVRESDVMITRGSQMALYLLGQLLFQPGDAVAVEAYGYAPAHRALSARGARIVPVPLDAEGMQVDALAELCRRERVRAVYVTPHHQYPSTVCMSAARRMALLALARDRGLAVIEDDYDYEFHYEGQPVLPLASRDLGSVCYVGTLSKTFAPALRIGFLVAPPGLLASAAALRFDLDRQGDRVAERAVAELLEDGELGRHLLRTRGIYQARRDHAVVQLRQALPDVLRFEVPRGGMALWAHVRPPYTSSGLVAAAAEVGVHLQDGDGFSLVGPTQHVRIGFGGVPEARFRRAVGLLQGELAGRRKKRAHSGRKTPGRL
jgi:GntR family transcriptional regulator/MocR family aminotransferase